MRITLLATALVLLSCAPALAGEAEPSLDFFYPLLTRRPIIERELELKAVHVKSDEGRETEVAAAIEWPVLPRWQLDTPCAPGWSGSSRARRRALRREAARRRESSPVDRRAW